MPHDAVAYAMDHEAACRNLGWQVARRVRDEETLHLVTVAREDCFHFALRRHGIGCARRYFAADDKGDVGRTGHQAEGQPPAAAEEGQTDPQPLGRPAPDSVRRLAA